MWIKEEVIEENMAKKSRKCISFEGTHLYKMG